MQREHTNQFAMVAFIAAALLLAPSPSARGAAAEWCATSGVLPSDPSIPENARFQLFGEGSFVSLNNSVLEFDDTVAALRVAFLKEDVVFPPDGEWAFQVALRMISHNRQGLDFGAQVGLSDGSRWAPFGVARDTVGFIDGSGSQWIENASFSMDTTDAVHVYRIVKIGAGGNARIEVFVDGDPTPMLTVPYENLTATAAGRVVLGATSIVGTARFDVECFAFNTNGTGLTPCPGDINGDGQVDVNDLLSLLTSWGPCVGCPADINGDGQVNVNDLLSLLTSWGPCP